MFVSHDDQISHFSHHFPINFRNSHHFPSVFPAFSPGLTNPVVVPGAVPLCGHRGMSGADLANLLNEGAIVAARQNKAEIDADDIANALETMGWDGRCHRIRIFPIFLSYGS